MSATATNISLTDFNKINFVIAEATKVQENKKARVPAYLLQLNFGEQLMAEHKDKNKKDSYFSSAQLTEKHRLSDLNGRQLFCVANFPRKQIGNMKSDCLVTGVQDPKVAGDEKRKTTVAVAPSESVSNGCLVKFGEDEQVLESNARNLEWPEFSKADIQVGSVKQAKLIETSDKITRVLLEIDFGAGPIKTVVKWNKVPNEIVGKQVLAVVNIDQKDIKDEFGVDDASAALLSPKDGVWLEPLIPVANGYKLA